MGLTIAVVAGVLWAFTVTLWLTLLSRKVR